jgi:hypothetical protein
MAADHHVIVMGINHADVFAVVLRFDKALHDLFPFTAGEVAGLRTNDFDVGALEMASAKPFLRSIATLAPTVPCSSTTLHGLPATVFTSQSPISCLPARYWRSRWSYRGFIFHIN